MKKKVRAIEVDGRNFTWRLIHRDPATAVLRVWIADSSKDVWAEFPLPHADPWLDIRQAPDPPITPATVAALIRTKLLS